MGLVLHDDNDDETIRNRLREISIDFERGIAIGNWIPDREFKFLYGKRVYYPRICIYLYETVVICKLRYNYVYERSESWLQGKRISLSLKGMIRCNRKRKGKERRGEVVWSSKSLDWTIGRDGRRNERKRGVTRVTVGHGNVGGEGIERPAGYWQILL